MNESWSGSLLAATKGQETARQAGNIKEWIATTTTTPKQQHYVPFVSDQSGFVFHIELIGKAIATRLFLLFFAAAILLLLLLIHHVPPIVVVVVVVIVVVHFRVHICMDVCVCVLRLTHLFSLSLSLSRFLSLNFSLALVN